ncbi:DNA-directed RNA polymerase III subunit RPC3-like [Saccostrea echinata]|uniref:DNA-directed RNA polymerase III subunit RPC3-like n=1 Tax=Saccostrea echinata TaxID=191078 RepID=UPI002A806045|nr:DNA-directed RNA polymerase III subunit RPC3-like [Saccostrea echinata]
MSRRQHDVCRFLLFQHFGKQTSVVGRYLLQRSSCSLPLISSETSIEPEQVKKILCILIQQNIVTFEQHKRGYIEYSIKEEEILNRLRIPKYIYCAKTLYGDAAELLLEEVLQRGQVQMSKVIQIVMQRFNEALETSGKTKISESFVSEKFSSLVKTHFLQRCLDPVKSESSKVVGLEAGVEEETLYTLPDLSRKRKRSPEGGPPAKRPKSEDENQMDSDDGIFWRVNCERFHQHFRDQAIVQAISSKIDRNAGEVLRAILRASEVKTASMATATTPLSVTEIFNALPKDLMTRSLLETYLSLICDDSTNFLSRVGDSGGGMYSISIYEALTQLAKAHIESVVQERFGSKCLRIFRVLLLKKHLEQKQIEDFVMISAKEAKDLLYTLFSENFVTTTEISKTPDHAPSRTYYLFTVNIQQVASLVLDRCYKALYNAMLKKEAEVTEHRRLLDKQERMEAIAASVEDANQREEILMTITPSEQEQINKVRCTIRMLDQSELQISEGIFILERYLLYFKLRQKDKS